MLDIPEDRQVDAQQKLDVWAKLNATPRTINSKWLYDSIGSAIFDVITLLPEYYPTRTETEIFADNIQDIVSQLGSAIELVEYGSGSSEKTRFILDNHPDLRTYIPIEISAAYIEQSALRLQRMYPHLKIHPILGNFLGEHNLPDGDAGTHRVGFFPGSTIGNLNDQQIASFFESTRRSLGKNAKFLLGADMLKPKDILIPAYNDNIGITSAFNLNLLNRLNRELGADFDVTKFRHQAIWNDSRFQIEMHLISTQEQLITLGGNTISLKANESILTEISRKFPDGYLETLAKQHGWSKVHIWQDSQKWFQLILFETT